MAMSFDEAVAAVTAPGQTVLDRRDRGARSAHEGVRARPAIAARPVRLACGLGATRRSWSTRTSASASPRSWPRPTPSARMLVDHYGVTKGDRVAIGMRNYPEWITSFAAIISIGAIAVSLNAWWTADEMPYGLEDSGTKRADRRPGAGRAGRGRVRHAGHPHRGGALVGAAAPRRRAAGGRARPRRRPCRRWTSTPTTTPPSSTRRAPPAIPRARCRPIGRWSAPSWPSAAGPRPTCVTNPPTEPAPLPHRRSSWSCRCST